MDQGLRIKTDRHAILKLPENYKVVLLKNEFGDIEGMILGLLCKIGMNELVQLILSWQSNRRWLQSLRF